MAFFCNVIAIARRNRACLAGTGYTVPNPNSIKRPDGSSWTVLPVPLPKGILGPELSLVAPVRMRLIFAALLVLVLASAPAAPASWLRQLRLSPDGQHVLPQDDAEITVLTVRPFEILFRIPAENATLAQFTPEAEAYRGAMALPSSRCELRSGASL